MGVELNPFVRCECGKVHTRDQITPTTFCSCGLALWPQAWKGPSA